MNHTCIEAAHADARCAARTRHGILGVARRKLSITRRTLTLPACVAAQVCARARASARSSTPIESVVLRARARHRGGWSRRSRSSPAVPATTHTLSLCASIGVYASRAVRLSALTHVTFGLGDSAGARRRSSGVSLIIQYSDGKRIKTRPCAERMAVRTYECSGRPQSHTQLL
jgi:hypothetical protein